VRLDNRYFVEHDTLEDADARNAMAAHGYWRRWMRPARGEFAPLASLLARAVSAGVPE
jgi:hypothetical protein